MFRKRPQDLPVANELFWFSTVIYTVLSALISYTSQTFFISLISGLIEISILLFISFLFLYLRSVPKRWMQVTTALAGTGAIISIIILPLIYARVFIPVDATVQEIILTLIFILWFWNLSVMSHILKNALSSSYVLAALGAFTYVAVTYLILENLFPITQSS